ncbi:MULTISPECIES: DUF3172 domain-containing protein [Cyanophyceae]|uniref:DUF3172 domain-containing protein n=1 Tax=Cyanophyceae TaxID=3028117 RepID=UPI00016DC7CE|nr:MULTISPECIES: DUF3172 domain-containing protein [Cyanophyceae]ACA99151.1 conserved hypothetical protein [Picosynechococcus sp. PCC 7002]AMA08878.1 hypothetical protein AWQ23_05875 [Picosynechococcus sp. PCC 73109]ANV87025.1 hypothetical protein AWQ22_05870 [Picosynechococcus sp. PCC 7117]QCS49722.1 DUF3172 domain-containing protein [Picosynechococcus sp. PCC 11901]SMH34326.1 Protein of unknown function [Picosynechococcus sp. OG1]
MKRQTRSRYDRPPYDRPRYPEREPKKSLFNFNYATLALFGGIFVLGVTVGIGFSSSTNLNPTSIDSRLEIDRQAPDAELCQQFGASAIVTDMKIFVTLNPFNVFVTQPQMEPGCVIRQNNWAILERQNLVTSEQVNDCKRRMNTFGYTGSLQGSPSINCIYQNDAAGNLFLNQPGTTSVPESDRF